MLYLKINLLMIFFKKKIKFKKLKNYNINSVNLQSNFRLLMKKITKFKKNHLLFYVPSNKYNLIKII